MADIDILRTAYRDADFGVDSMHLSDERWERLACDELSSEDRQTAIDHILGCPLCTDTYKALRILRSEARDFDPAVPTHDEDLCKKSPSRRGLWGGLGLLTLAAAVMMVVVLPTFLPRAPVPNNGNQALRSAGVSPQVTAVSPVDQVVDRNSQTTLILRWTTDDPESPAVVEILDGDGELIWTSPETTATEIDWPSDVAEIPGRYYWRVVAAGPGDTKISSPLVSFVIADKDVSASRP